MNELINLKSRLSYSNVERFFKTQIIGTSDCNISIPTYVIGAHQLIEFENNKKVLEYRMPFFESNLSYNSTRQYDNLLYGLKTLETPSRYTYKIGDNEHFFYFLRGIMYDENANILLCLSINSEYLLNTPIQEVLETPDKTKFTLFINNLFLEPQYKNIYKKINLEYISKCKSLEIDVIETSRINNWIFSNNFTPPKFRTVEGLKNHLKEIPSLILKD